MCQGDRKFPLIDELLAMMEPGRKNKLVFNKFDIWMLAILVVLALGIGACVTSVKLGWMEMEAAKMVVLCLYGTLLVVYLAWLSPMLKEVAGQIRYGFKQAAEVTKARMEHEESVIEHLMRYPRQLLREKSRLVDLEAKRWTRRAGVGAALNAASVVGITLFGAIVSHDAGAKVGVPFLAGLGFPTMLVYALMFGLLLGSAAIYVFAARLEKVAGVLLIAADREC